MVAACPEKLDARRRVEPGRIGVLTSEREDHLRDVTPVRARRQRPERRLGDGAPGPRRLDVRLDHLGHERDGVAVQPVDRSASQRLATEQNRFPQAQVVDPSGVRGVAGPREVGGVASGHDVDAPAEHRIERVRERGQLRHVPGVGRYAAAAGEVGADAPQHDVREAQRLARDLLEIAGHDAFPEIAELDHEHDAVEPARGLRGERERTNRVDPGVEAHVGVRDDAGRLAEHRRAQEGHRGRDLRPTHGLYVLDAGVAQPPHASAQQRAGDGRRSEGGLRDAGDGDSPAGQPCHQRPRIVADLVEVDLESRRAHRTPAISVSARCGNAEQTMSARCSGGRVSASVAGMPSSRS